MRAYTKEELWKLFEKLPQELKEAVFSQETADHIFSVCERNEVEDVSKVASYVGLVLMGVLLPSDFQKTLQSEMKIDEPTAKSLATEINRFVFYPVRPALEQLHKMEIEVSARIVTPQPAEEGEAPTEKPKQEPRGPDSYRETIE